MALLGVLPMGNHSGGFDTTALPLLTLLHLPLVAFCVWTAVSAWTGHTGHVTGSHMQQWRRERYRRLSTKTPTKAAVTETVWIHHHGDVCTNGMTQSLSVRYVSQNPVSRRRTRQWPQHAAAPAMRTIRKWVLVDLLTYEEGTTHCHLREDRSVLRAVSPPSKGGYGACEQSHETQNRAGPGYVASAWGFIRMHLIKDLSYASAVESFPFFVAAAQLTRLIPLSTTVVACHLVASVWELIHVQFIRDLSYASAVKSA